MKNSVVIYNALEPVVNGTVSKTLSRFRTALFNVRCGYGLPAATVSRNYFFINVYTKTKHKTASVLHFGENSDQRRTSSRIIQPLRRTVHFNVSQLACTLYIMAYCVAHALAVDTCVTYMCMESSGGVVAVRHHSFMFKCCCQLHGLLVWSWV